MEWVGSYLDKDDAELERVFFENLVQIETNTNRHVEKIEASLGKPWI